MGKIAFASLVLGAFAAGGVFGQETAPPSSSGAFQAPPLAPAVTQPAPAVPLRPVSGAVIPACEPGCVAPPPIVIPDRPNVWFDIELLVWWVKGAPLPAPIGVVSDGSGNWQTVIGSSTNGFGANSGLRLSLGAWFDDFNNYGFETSFFSLGRASNRQSLISDDNGNPTIGLSYLSKTPGQPGEYIQQLSEPGSFAGSIFTRSTLDLWGAEVNGSICLVRTAGFEFITLAGFRYLNLHENLFISSGSTDLSSGDFIELNDRFSARNQFYGGQLGARVNWMNGPLSLSATGKLALGATRQNVDIQGSSFASSSGEFNSGFYAEPSNSGHRSATQFGVIPSVELKASYVFSPYWRLFMGYDFMYWNQVVRPGNQLDRNINLTQNPILGTGTLVGPAFPGFLFNRSDFWAQGMTIGLEFRF